MLRPVLSLALPLATTAIFLSPACQAPPHPAAAFESSSQDLAEQGGILAQSVSAPAIGLKAGVGVCSWGPNRLDLFARGNDDHLWHAFFINGNWSAWEDLFAATFVGGTKVKLGGPPSCVSWGPNRIDIVFPDANSKLGHVWFDKTWGTWEALGPSFSGTNASEQFGISSWGTGRLDIFRRTAGNDLAHFTFDNAAGGWATSWNNELTGALASAPSAVSWAANRIDVVFRNANDGGLGHWWYDGQPHPNDPRGGTVPGRPAIASRARELLDILFVPSAGGAIQHKWFDYDWAESDTWNIGNITNLDAVSWGPGRVDIVFQKSGDANVWHTRMPTTQVLTQHNDNFRTGSNTREIELKPGNVVAGRFGKLFERQVIGDVYAQILYVSNLDTTSNGRRNMIFVATEHNMIYGFDADDPSVTSPLAQVGLGCPVPLPTWNIKQGTQPPGGTRCYFNLVPEMGITSTPVIDPATSTMYVVNLEFTSSFTADGDQCSTLAPVVAIPSNCTTLDDASKPTPQVHYVLRALDLRDAKLKTLRQVSLDITGLTPLKQNQRPALLLSGGNVVIAFGGHTDSPNYAGLVASYRASDFAQMGVFNATAVGSPMGCPPSGGGGIWQSGQGLATDESGNIYFQTGNGKFDNTRNFSDSVIKLTPTLGLSSTFTPFNELSLSQQDADLGSGGALVLPGQNMVVGGGKEGFVYLMDTSNLGGYRGPSLVNPSCSTTTGSDAVAQSFKAIHQDSNSGPYSNIHGSPVYWDSPQGPSLYLWPEHDRVYRYILTNKRAHTTTVTGPRPYGDSGTWQDGIPDATSVEVAAGGAFGAMPGGVLSISSSVNKANTGIVWGTTEEADATADVAKGHMTAFDAADLHKLWSSADDPNDTYASGFPGGMYGKFNPPTVANGKVYVANFAPSSSVVGAVNNIWDRATRLNKIIVYGLKGK